MLDHPVNHVVRCKEVCNGTFYAQMGSFVRIEDNGHNDQSLRNTQVACTIKGATKLAEAGAGEIHAPSFRAQQQRHTWPRFEPCVGSKLRSSRTRRSENVRSASGVASVVDMGDAFVSSSKVNTATVN